MDDEEGRGPDPSETYEVGYKKPPREYQFKKGHQPKRKPRVVAEKRVYADLLWSILNEARRIGLNGRKVTMTNIELIVRRLVEKAEQGNASMQALLYELMLMKQREDWEDHIVIDIQHA